MKPRCFYVVPHTHWDREWYRPFEYFRLRLGHVVDGVIDVLERDPAFTRFTLDGQAVVLEDYLDVRPENEGRLRRLLGEGRIEVGPSYILPDEFLVGGEPLVRNLLIGRAVCERFGAEPSPVGYLPDSFGHPLQLPQILVGFGIESFIFSRGLGEELDHTGVVFRWRAPDGSQVLALQQLPEYGNFAAPADVEDAENRIRHIVGRFGDALERAGVDDVLLCNGTDHLPVMPEMPEMCSELERRFPGSRFVIAGYADYVAAVGAPDVPVWSGELVGGRLHNILRGVNSARLYVKQANERAEQRLLAAETLCGLRHLRDGWLPGSDLRLAWRDLLRCHPHDTICGCSCDEVHRDAMARYESLGRTISVLEERAVGPLIIGSDDGRNVGVLNLLPYRRSCLVEMPGAAPAMVEVEGFAARTVTMEAAGEHGAMPPTDDAAIESERFRVEAGDDGTLSITDKSRDRRFEGLHALEDEHDMGDLYNFCPAPGTGTWRSRRATTRVLARGPVVFELEIVVEDERPAGLDAEARPLESSVPLRVSTVVRLVQGLPRVEFRTTIENAARDHRLRIVFPVGAEADGVRAEGQFAVVRRPLGPPPSQSDWVEPPDPTAHTLGAVAAGALALIAKGLPEYELRAAGAGAEVCLTLLRCVGLISQPEGAIATRPHTAGPQLSTPEGQCLGRHECEYALITDADHLDDVGLLRSSQDYRSPFLLAMPGLELAPGLELSGEVIFSCLKGAEDDDGLILRCFNPSDAPAGGRISGPVTVSRARLDETGEEPVPDGRFELEPGQIGTFRLRRASRVTAAPQL